MAGFIALFVAIPLTALQLACAPMPPRAGGTSTYNGGGAAGAAPSGWRAFTVAPGTTVAMPSPPRSERAFGRLDDGSRLTTDRYLAQFYAITVLVAVSEVEGGVGGNPFELLDGMLDGFLESTDGMDIVESDATWLQGHPGTVLQLRGQDRRVMVHQYVSRSRMYLFAFATPLEDAARAAPSEQAFFASIRFDANEALSPAGDGRLDTTRFQWIFPPEGSFAAEMPGNPTRTETSVRIADDTYDAWTYETRNADGTHVMRVRTISIERPTRRDGLLTTMQSLAATDGGVVRGVRPAQRQGYGGQAFVVELPTVIRFVVQVVTPGGVIEMVHQMPRGEENAQTEHRRRFFNSLRIL